MCEEQKQLLARKGCEAEAARTSAELVYDNNGKNEERLIFEIAFIEQTVLLDCGIEHEYLFTVYSVVCVI